MNQIETVLFNLRTISNIGRGKRISTAKQFIKIEEDALLQPYFRWKTGDSRERAIFAVCREIRLAIAFSNLMLESRELDDEQKTTDRGTQLIYLRRNLMAAAYGIRNLCDTYHDDENVAGHLLPLLKEIECAVEESEVAYPNRSA